MMRMFGRVEDKIEMDGGGRIRGVTSERNEATSINYNHYRYRRTLGWAT